MAVADLLDGFAVEPDPQRMRSMRMIVILAMAGGVVIAVSLVALAVYYKRSAFLVAGLGYLLLIAAADWFLWLAIKAQALKADSMSVTYTAANKTTQVPRSELSMIFKGQTYVRGRGGGWVRGYIFTAVGGKVAFAVPEVWFRSDDVAEFARRLGLPMRGDFSERVRDVVSESS